MTRSYIRNSWQLLYFICRISVNAFPYTSVRLECKLATHVGSCTAWNMAFNRTDKCLLTSQWVVVMTASILSSAKLVPANMCLEPCSSILNLLSLVSIFLNNSQFSSTNIFKTRKVWLEYKSKYYIFSVPNYLWQSKILIFYFKFKNRKYLDINSTTYSYTLYVFI